MSLFVLTVSLSALGLPVVADNVVVIAKKRILTSDAFPPIINLYEVKSLTNVSGIATASLDPDDATVYHEIAIYDLLGVKIYTRVFTMPPQAVALTALPVPDIITVSAAEAVAAAAAAAADAIATAADRVQTGLDAVATAADRVQTGLDVIATNADAVATAADRVQTGLDRVQTGADANSALIAKNAAEAARDIAQLSSGIYATTAAGIGNGVAGTSGLVSGSGGTNGTFALAFSGGTQVIAPTGYFVVASGAVTQVVITYKGYYSAGTPTISFSASSGLTGASVTAVMAANTPINQYFSVPQSSPSDIMFDLYKNNAGVALYINSYSSGNLIKYSAHAQAQYNFVDADGFIIASMTDGEIKTLTNTVSAGLLDAGTFIVQYLSDVISQSFTLIDPDGFIYATLSAIGKLKSTAFELDSGLLDTTLWSITHSTLVDGYLLTDQDGFILMSLDGTDGLQAVGLTSSAAVSTLPHAKKIAVFGDSRTEQISVETSNAVTRLKRVTDYGYLAWAHYFTSGNIEFVCNAGIGGNTTTQMLSRFNSDVLPFLPDELWGEGGINDYALSEETTKANLTNIFDLADANGIYVRWSTISPLAAAHASFSAANVARICNINKWLKEQALTRKNLTVVDSFGAMIDRASTNGIPKSGMMQTDDSIHQAPKGALAQGYAFAQSFIKDHNIIDYLPQFAGQRYSLNSAFKQIFNNPLFTSSGGTNSTSGVVTGAIPANCTISKTGTWGSGLVTSALVARADGFGYDWVLTITNAGAENDELSITTEGLESSISNSDILYACAEVSLSGLAKNRGFYLEIRSTVNAVFSNVSTLEYSTYQPIATDPWTDDMYSQENVVGVLRTPNLTIGSTGTISSVYARFKFRFGGVGSTATIKIGRMAICKN